MPTVDIFSSEIDDKAGSEMLLSYLQSRGVPIKPRVYTMAERKEIMHNYKRICEELDEHNLNIEKQGSHKGVKYVISANWNGEDTRYGVFFTDITTREVTQENRHGDSHINSFKAIMASFISIKRNVCSVGGSCGYQLSFLGFRHMPLWLKNFAGYDEEEPLLVGYTGSFKELNMAEELSKKIIDRYLESGSVLISELEKLEEKPLLTDEEKNEILEKLDLEPIF